jgi:hypothetical protein
MIASWSSRTLQKSLGAVVATTGIGSGLLYWCEYEGTRRAMKVGRSTSQIVRKDGDTIGRTAGLTWSTTFPCIHSKSVVRVQCSWCRDYSSSRLEVFSQTSFDAVESLNAEILWSLCFVSGPKNAQASIWDAWVFRVHLFLLSSFASSNEQNPIFWHSAMELRPRTGDYHAQIGAARVHGATQKTLSKHFFVGWSKFGYAGTNTTKCWMSSMWTQEPLNCPSSLNS